MTNRMATDEEIRFLYGKSAVITRKDRFTFVHLDKPRKELADQRTQEFDPETFFKCDCRVCQLTKESGIVIFDETPYEEEQ
jgi:hypothetical protein